MQKWKVTREESGCKLGIFLSNKLDSSFSKRQIKRAIDNGLCFVNNKPERFSNTLLSANDIVSFDIASITPLLFVRAVFDPERILFEDHDLLAYNKPAKVVSDGKQFLEVLHEYSQGLQPVHRLDRDTTGVLLLAKNKPMVKEIGDLFRHRQVEKVYYAIVDGFVETKQGVIDNYLGKVGYYAGHTLWGSVDPSHGFHARTHWKCEARGKTSSLVRCMPQTGRTHQIRVHMSGLGHPILGDYEYGKHFVCDFRPERCLLHAQELRCAHPMTGETMVIKAPLPDDFREAMKRVGICKFSL